MIIGVGRINTMAKVNCEVCGYGIPFGSLHKEKPCAHCRRRERGDFQ